MKTLPILLFSLFAVLISVAQVKGSLQPFQKISDGENSQTKAEKSKSENPTGYSILNMQGMTVKSGILNDYCNSISIVEFTPCMYFVSLKGENRVHSAKILKQ